MSEKDKSTGDTINITKDTKEQDILKLGEDCDKCGKCCTYGSGFVLEHEIPRITAFLNIPKEKFIKDLTKETEIFHTKIFKINPWKKESKPYGPCMFLENNLCKIQDVKPLHCRIGNCSKRGDDLHTWFIVNHCLNAYDPESIRQYKSYLDTGGRVLPGAELEKIFPDKEKLKQILSYERFM
ncbi:YkgJ family cysteine cluster protein [Nanoarchaeota archaeon]